MGTTYKRMYISKNNPAIKSVSSTYVTLETDGKHYKRRLYGSNRFVFNHILYIFDESKTIDFSTKSVFENTNEIEPMTQSENGIIKHHKHSTILNCIKNDIPVYLVGEAGTGKNFTLQKIAEELNLDFYFTNSVQQEFKITGFIDAGGRYHETEFYKAFKNGGLFFLDEMDASIPEVLVLLNAAIANRYFEFPSGKIEAHPDFRIVAAGNTYGTGASINYNGRFQLDSATLDRFVVIEFDYDKNIELNIANGDENLVNLVRTLRNDKSIAGTYSYRCIINITKLKDSGISLCEVLRIALLKGMDKDTLNTITRLVSGIPVYGEAIKKLANIAA